MAAAEPAAGLFDPRPSSALYFIPKEFAHFKSKLRTEDEPFGRLRGKGVSSRC